MGNVLKEKLYEAMAADLLLLELEESLGQNESIEIDESLESM